MQMSLTGRSGDGAAPRYPTDAQVRRISWVPWGSAGSGVVRVASSGRSWPATLTGPSNEKAAHKAAFSAFGVSGSLAVPVGTPRSRSRPRLLDLGFLELDVLLDDRVVLLERQLVGHRTRVLLGHVEIAGVSGRQQLDLDGGRLRHGGVPSCRAAGGDRSSTEKQAGRSWDRPALARNLAIPGRMSRRERNGALFR